MQPGETLIPKDEHGVPLVDTEVTHQQTWSAMYACQSIHSRYHYSHFSLQGGASRDWESPQHRPEQLHQI